VLLRPVKPEDEDLERKALERLSEESLRFRFFKIPHRVTHEMLTRYCNIDYDREMTIIAEYNDNGEKRSVGNSRLLIQPDGESGEFAVLVADDFHGSGLGLKLMDMIIGIGREKGLKIIYGVALAENTAMIKLAKRLGFTVEKYAEDEVKFTLEL
jgi:acetyltransferase